MGSLGKEAERKFSYVIEVVSTSGQFNFDECL